MIYRCDLTKQYNDYSSEILDAARRVFESGRYLLADELNAFEGEFAEYCEANYCCGVASGTDALILALKSLGIEHGDEVVTTPFTAVPTVSAIVWIGAIPRFADIDDDTLCLNPELLREAITPKTKAVLPVHLFGQSADIEEIVKIADENGLSVIEDAAQAVGTMFNGKKAGTFGRMGCFSFYPTKNLGGYGDGGAIVTNDQSLWEDLKLMRNYGMTAPYVINSNGTNSRLDEIQAAILRVKLRYLDAMNDRRSLIAAEYAKQLNGTPVRLPVEFDNIHHSYHVYVIRTGERNRLQEYLTKNGVQTNIYYPVGLHLQQPYEHLGYRLGDCPITEKACNEVLALPFYPEIAFENIGAICELIRDFYR